MSIDPSTLSTLTIEQAKHLAKYEGGYLSLNGLKTLDAPVAWELARYKGDLYLDGLTDLTAEAAKALALHEGGCLSFASLTTLPPDVAKAFCGFKNDLLLNGLTQIADDTYKALSHRACGLTLDGLRSLSSLGAKALAQPTGWALSLERPAPLPESVQKRLSRVSGKALVLDGVSELTPEVESLLAKHSGYLSLAGLTSLKTADLANTLFLAQQGLNLRHLQHLTVDAVHGLTRDADYAKYEWIEDEELDLPFLRELSVEMAGALSDYHGAGLTLGKVTSISEEVANLLGQFEGRWLDLTGLQSLPAAVATGLAAYTGTLRLNALEEIDADAEEALAAGEGIVRLPSLKRLTRPALAAKMCDPDFELELDRLTLLSEEAAEALAKDNDSLSLPSVTSLTLRAAKAFSACRGRVLLTGLEELTDECAAVLAEFSGESLDLGFPGRISATADKLLRANNRVTVMNAAEAAEAKVRQENFMAQVQTFFAQVAEQQRQSRNGRCAEESGAGVEGSRTRS